jgi:branched-subunit amino acid transport protein AzlD
MKKQSLFLVLSIGAFALLVVSCFQKNGTLQKKSGNGPVSYNFDIRPILV